MTTNAGGTFVHDGEADMMAGNRVIFVSGGEADAVIADGKSETVTTSEKFDGDGCGLGVFTDIGERFLNNVKGLCFGFGVEGSTVT